DAARPRLSQDQLAGPHVEPGGHRLLPPSGLRAGRGRRAGQAPGVRRAGTIRAAGACGGAAAGARWAREGVPRGTKGPPAPSKPWRKRIPNLLSERGIMKRLLALGLGLGVLALAVPSWTRAAPTDKDKAAAKEALQALQDFIGDWKGSGAP